MIMDPGAPDDLRLARIHAASLALLEATGFRVESADLLSRCKARGLRVDGNRVFFSARQVEDALASVPRRFRLLARNPAYSLSDSNGKAIGHRPPPVLI
jgi:trimethylamine--corrinoid protein Co-methyltransferase